MVRTVDNGKDVIVLTKIDNYGLVLCDIALPEVFGYNVIKALNELEKMPKIGIITGWSEKLKSPEAGLIVDFIVKKPFDFSRLAGCINSVFDAEYDVH